MTLTMRNITRALTIAAGGGAVIVYLVGSVLSSLGLI